MMGRLYSESACGRVTSENAVAGRVIARHDLQREWGRTLLHKTGPPVSSSLFLSVEERLDNFER